MYIYTGCIKIRRYGMHIVPKEATFPFSKIMSEYYFFNESNFKLTNKRFS